MRISKKIEHIPVLLAEVVEYLNCRVGALVVDCTLGGGGHAAAILDKITPTGIVIGIDKDKAAIDAAKIKLAHFGQQTLFVKDDFQDLGKILKKLNIAGADGILFDLGISSLQLDEPERGFSYRVAAPLDMRMDIETKLTAAKVVNLYPKERLTAILRDYGEERWASRIADFICHARKRTPISTTSQLVEVIKAAIPASARRRGGHPAKQTFQAIRIEVNNELKALKKALPEAIDYLKSGGRLVVISYHSLEDRVTKQVFKDLARGCVCPQGLLTCQCGRKQLIEILTRRPVTPSTEEVSSNPRARGAKLRAVEKL